MLVLGIGQAILTSAKIAAQDVHKLHIRMKYEQGRGMCGTTTFAIVATTFEYILLI
jgi:hypothetical protein